MEIVKAKSNRGGAVLDVAPTCSSGLHLLTFFGVNHTSVITSFRTADSERGVHIVLMHQLAFQAVQTILFAHFFTCLTGLDLSAFPRSLVLYSYLFSGVSMHISQV